MKVTTLIVCLLAFVFTFQAQTFAVDFSVNLTGDAGDFTCDATCSLRDAIDDANAAVTDDTISFAAGITNITLSTNQIDINNAGTLTINGSGANVLTIDGGAGMNRIFLVNSATVTIRGVTLTGGNGNGAAVRVNDGTLILEAVVVQNNVGDSQEGAVFYGGGTNHRIANSTFSGNTDFGACSAFRALGASLTVFNTTVSGNSTTRGIGAICFLGNSTATFRNTTISDNIADGTDGGGGGIFIQDTATVDLGNTIVSGNISGGAGPDLYRFTSTATFTTSGGNLIRDISGNPDAPNTTTFPYNANLPTGTPNANGDKVGITGDIVNPLLGPLTIANGGTTPTRALQTGSPAIDAGINDLANAAELTTDQRGTGFARIRDGNSDGTATVDIGAFEVQFGTTAATVSVSGRVLSSRRSGVSNAVVHLTNQNGEFKLPEPTVLDITRLRNWKSEKLTSSTSFRNAISLIRR